MKIDEDITLIAGPTASGKTGLAIEIAQRNDALIINTDSMQVYGDLRVITARPSREEAASAPHFLYGHIDGGDAYSVAKWLEDVSSLLSKNSLNSTKLVFVGGTGLYFNALLEGLSPVPQIDPEIRAKWRQIAQEFLPEKLHQHLVELDSEMAGVLNPTDSQRIIRAIEVFESTGRSLAYWQNMQGESVLPTGATQRKILLMPERQILHERINSRFEQMVEEGGLNEVRALLEKGYPQNASVMKAIGVPQLAAHLNGDILLSEAIERAKAATRQYAKRQSTWFRNSFDEDWNFIS